MNHSVTKLDGSQVKLTLTVTPEQFEEAIQTVYNKAKKNIQLPGFRKGKAPRKMIERAYGKEVFYEDALNEVLPDLYEAAVKEENLEVMSRPDVTVDTISADEPFEVVCTVYVKPEVTLGEYKGLKKEMEEITVSDEDIDEEIASVANRNARTVEVTDRPAAMGDTVTLSYDGSVDGVHFDGGQSDSYELKLGSHSFIDTFEDQIVGHNVGDAFDVNVTFPEEYHEPSLSGKAAVFAVEVKAIKTQEVPEIDDEFVKEVSEFDTLDEYKEDTKKTLIERRQKAAEETAKNKLIKMASDNASVDLPEPVVTEQCDQMVQEFARTLAYQGMDINQYMKMTGTTLEQLRNDVRPQAEQRLKENLTLEAIAKAEGISVTDEDVDKEIEEMAKVYSMEVEKVREFFNGQELDNMKQELLNRKAVAFLVENAVD